MVGSRYLARGRKGMYSRNKAKMNQRKLNRRQKGQVQRLIRVNRELKFINSITRNAAVTITSSVTDFTALITQGNTDSQRDGDRIKLSYMKFRGQAFVGDSSNAIRCIVFQWKPNTLPLATDLLLTGPTQAIPVVDPYSEYNHDTRLQYRILYDTTWQLIGNGAAATTPFTDKTAISFSRNIRPKLKQVQFVGAGTSGMNHVYILFVSDSTVLPNPTVTFTFKLFYSDS